MRRSSIAIVIAALLVLAGAAGWGAHYFKPAPRLPDLLTLTRLDGQTVNLKDFQGQPLVINFWASWCTFCRREMPMLEKYAQYDGLTMVLINQGDTLQAITDYMQGTQVRFEHSLLDPVYTAQQALQVRGVPTTLFYDADGRLVDQHAGELDDGHLARFVQNHLE